MTHDKGLGARNLAILLISLSGISVTLKFVIIKADMAIRWQECRERFLSDQPIFKETLMSTSAVSSSSLNQQIQQYFHTRQTDLHDLGKALGTGDLADAQTEYNNIAQLGQNGPFSSGNPFSNSTREQDFTAIGTALQSGNLTAAQQAFASLKSTFQNGNGGPPATISNPLPNPGAPAPVGPEIIINLSNSSTTGGASAGSTNNGGQPVPVATPILTSAPSSAGSEIIINLGNSSGSSNPEEITLNLSSNSSGGEQVSLSIGQQGSTNPQQIQFNLPANSNEEIVLNLGSSSSTASSTSTTTSTSGGLSVSA
jgi:hypothetical protein